MLNKKILLLFRRAPYGSTYTAEGFRTIVGFVAFEASVALVLVDDGVYWAVKGQNPIGLDMHPMDQALSSLKEEYEVSEVYVDSASLADRGLSQEELVEGLQMVNREELQGLLDRHDAIVPF